MAHKQKKYQSMETDTEITDMTELAYKEYELANTNTFKYLKCNITKGKNRQNSTSFKLKRSSKAEKCNTP